MIDLGSVLRIAGGGIASVFTVLLTLALIIWIISLILRRAASKSKKN
jgi:Na+-transporting methylmalonyl-CoA/oxaloacetate decarboxylase gamma subunit